MKILVADDHALFRDALNHALHQLDANLEVLEAQNWQTALTLCEAHPDLSLALVDLNMPGMTARNGLNSVLEKAQTIPVVVISASENQQDMQFAINAGAAGYICKNESTPVILSAINLVLNGGIFIPSTYIQNQHELPGNGNPKLSNELTPRQMDVLQEIIKGKSNKEIAMALNLSVVTVKIHITSIFKALQVNSRLQVIKRAQELGIQV